MTGAKAACGALTGAVLLHPAAKPPASTPAPLLLHTQSCSPNPRSAHHRCVPLLLLNSVERAAYQASCCTNEASSGPYSAAATLAAVAVAGGRVAGSPADHCQHLPPTSTAASKSSCVHPAHSGCRANDCSMKAMNSCGLLHVQASVTAGGADRRVVTVWKQRARQMDWKAGVQAGTRGIAWEQRWLGISFKSTGGCCRTGRQSDCVTCAPAHAGCRWLHQVPFHGTSS